ncbi:Glu/Leu/Phe/Val family dehydrogenase [Raineya orbicola]|jgi:leucine dehydrogenase|uniref:Glutamate dehydrogenase/leucine dehydrogenase n=1 Tax=Raineya orbicola TaxID=2016530 RepID=A0A2N3IK07_9BACT|nr:Glu/Leu/Phe/Val dehydrogenase [Raineya orbicola]PKQ70672.1 Glutamate dehydrogenase/leucine dehydrogenase [Raineya orbicola]
MQSIFEQLNLHQHEQVVFCNDPHTGLKAIIAIHNTTLGPAAGGTRMWLYNSEAEALNDVLRLSRGMTYKNAVAGLNIGGGKAVIIGDARKHKSEALFRAFGRFVDSLGGKYITAEDVGISTQDMEFVSMETPFVAGKPKSLGGSGDPSPFTAYGVYIAMKACAKKVYGSESLAGKKIAVQGVGHVGQNLVEHLIKENAQVLISDIYEDRLQAIKNKFPQVQIVDKDKFYDVEMDIYAPCALGATINDETLSKLKCKIIAGAANNQLADENRHADMCASKGILYAPDFLINSGGIINVYCEIAMPVYNEQRAYEQTERIYQFTTDIIETAEKENINTHQAAVALAHRRMEAIARLNANAFNRKK